MAGFEGWRWAAYRIQQALSPARPEPLAPECVDAASREPTSSGCREKIESSYEARIKQNEQRRDAASSMRVRCFRYVVACAVVLGAVLFVSRGAHWISPWLAALPLAAGVFAFAKARRCKRRVQDANSLMDLYSDRLRRVRHQWVGKGDSGSDLEMPGHLSAADLDLFGEGSLFELLCDVQTPTGREVLAQWLQVPAKTDEVISRQQSIRYLRERIDVREKLALVHVGKANDYSWNMFRNWLTADPIKFPRWAPWVGLLLSLSLAVIGGCWGLGLLQAHDTMWTLATVAAAEGGLALWLRARVKVAMEGLMFSASKLDSMRRLCGIVEAEKLETSGLKDLQHRLRGSSKCLAQLQGLVARREARRNELFVYASLLLMWGTQWAIRIERWRQRRGRELLERLNVLGEFEALLAIASYAYENPDDPNPGIEKNGPLFEATGLGHPLMDPAVCVRNDVKLHDQARFLMVTGSNMSGKSTLLRTVGLNATLAWMGAPVRATQLRLSQLQICASIHVEDSLMRGLSHFYAEVQRLKAMLDAATSGPSVLFLIDELFAGTNSADRRIAAEAVIRLLIERHAIGLATSHDLALTEIAEEPSLFGDNVHFSDTPTAKGLNFDYRIRPGKLDHGNALKIIQMVGIPLR
jgi:MutS domain V